MRSAARQPEPEAAPDRADLDAKAAGLLGGHAVLIAGAQALMARCPDPQSAVLLKQLITETISTGIHLEELRSQMASYEDRKGRDDVLFEAGRAFERAQAAKAAVPGPRHSRRASRWQPGEGQRALFSVRLPALGAAAVLALRPLLKHAGHAVTHPAAIRLTAHTVKMAAAAAAVPAAGGLLIAGAVIVTHPSPHGTPGGSSAGAPAPGWHTSASPILSSPAAVLAAAGPKARHAARGRTLLSAAGALTPAYGPAPGPSATASASPSVSVSVQAAGTLSVTADGLPLGAGTGLSLGAGDGTDLLTGTFTITAAGGPASYGVISSRAPDVSVSPASGTLQAGESATITVSVSAAAQLLDGDASVRVWGGSQAAVLIPVSWLAAVIPSVVPSPAASVLPSPAASLLG